MRHSLTSLILITFLSSFMISCSKIPNSPYPMDELEENYFYGSYDTVPKTLDPAVSYSSNEATIIGSMYEPPFMYHPLKRPYILIPNSVREMPRPEYSKEVMAIVEAKSVQVSTILSKEENSILKSNIPLIIGFFNTYLSEDKLAKADAKVVAKRLQLLQNESLKSLEAKKLESTIIEKLTNYIFEKTQILVENLISAREEISVKQFESRLDKIFADQNKILVFKTDLSRNSLLANILEDAKDYWTKNDWNVNQILSVTGDIVSKKTGDQMIKIKSVEAKTLNNEVKNIISIDANVEYPKDAELLAVTGNSELITLVELSSEELTLFELTDNTSKYFKIASTKPLNENLAKAFATPKDKGAKDNAGNINTFKIIDNQIILVSPEHYKVDFDALNSDGSIFSIGHFEDLDKLAGQESLILSFKFWIPSSEDECRDINLNLIDYAHPPHLRDLKVLYQMKKNPQIPMFVNTGNVHAVYTMHVMPGIYYQPHPCFSKDPETKQFLFHEGKKPFIKTVKQDDGKVINYIHQNGVKVEISDNLKKQLEGNPIDESNLSNVFDLDDFAKYFPEYDPNSSTRELTAADYVYQIKRMLNPLDRAQIAESLLFPYIENTRDYANKQRSKIIAERKHRRAEIGTLYSQEVDEEENPINIDYDMDKFDGAKVLDRYTYQIVLTQPYPQFKYWMAMPFFSPMPWEADMFFRQGPMQKNTLTLSKFPVATGAYRMWKYQRQLEISSIRNENFNRLGPDDGKKPPVFKETAQGSNILMSSMPLGVSENDKTPGTGVDKNKNGKLDGSNDIRDYLVKNDYEELPFFDENGNGIYDGIRYWNPEERNASIQYSDNFIDFNGNGVYDKGDRKVNFAEGIYFEDLDLDGVYNSEINEMWYKFPATYRTVYPYAGEDNVCPDEHIDELLKMQRQAQKLWVEMDKNKQQLRDLDDKILKEMIRVIEEYNYSQDDIGDEASGILRDSGRRLPFIDAIIRRKEKEPTSIWSKFEQGYYEYSGIGEEKFDKVIDMSIDGAYLSDELKDKGIQLRTSVRTSIGYIAFNMQNQTWGWSKNYDDAQPDIRKAYIRQACSIAFDFEEFNDTFYNGRNASGHMAIPPGIYGYESPEKQTFIDSIDDLEYYFSEEITKEEDDKRTKVTEMTPAEIADWGEKYAIIFSKFSELSKAEQSLALKQKYDNNKAKYMEQGVKPEDVKIENNTLLAEVHFGMNWTTYTWNKKTKSAERRSITYAKKLLAKGGYPGGKDASGNQLVLDFLSMGVSPADLDIANWREKKLKEIGVTFKSSAVDYSKFQEMVRSGGYECLGWGWNADYPDPENFLFLLQGKNAKCASNSLEKMSQGGGENAANYWSEDYDKLFVQMSTMSDSPERLRIIRKMSQLLRRDTPWIYSNLGVSYILFNKWYRNSKTNLIGNNSYWFRRINADVRAEYRAKHNKAKWWPVFLFFFVVILALVPGIVSKARKEKKTTGKISD